MRFRLTLLVALLLVMAAAAPAKSRQYAAIVMDYETGEVLHSRRADTKVYPASLTKMMTLYMLFEALDRGDLSLSSRLSASRRAAGMPASKLGLSAGSTITVDDAVKALTTRSANDVAVVVAEALGGTEIAFARMMTKRARQLGMDNTTFMNASGLPNSDQKSTARDMAVLSAKLLAEHRARYKYFSTDSFKYRGRTYRSHNRLMKRYRGMDGIKTGYIRASGFNLAASAARDGRRVIVVVFGGRTARSRDDEVARLLDLGFERLLERRGPAQIAGPPVPKPATATTVATAPQPEAGPAIDTADRGAPLPSASETLVAAAEPASRVVTDSTAPTPRVVPSPRIEEAAASPTQVAAAETNASREAAPVPERKPTLRLATGPEKARATGRYGVQVGAYHDPDLARRAAYRAASRVPDILLGGDVDISALNGRRKPVFRARLVGLNKDDADEACRRLRARDHDCLVVQTRDLQLAEHRG